jgi:hypothetical protein
MDMTVRIPIAGRRRPVKGYFVVDAEDGDLAALAWPTLSGIGYPSRSVYLGTIDKKPRYKLEYAHRVVAARMNGGELPVGAMVDHINGDRMDARRCNLRIVTPSGNNQNRGTAGKNTYRGIVKIPRGWRACVRFKKKNNYGPPRDTVEEAAADAKAIRHELGFLSERECAVPSPVQPTKYQYGRRVPASNTSGYLNVNWHGQTGKWSAVVYGKHYGLFTTVEEAAAKVAEVRSQMAPA